MTLSVDLHRAAQQADQLHQQQFEHAEYLRAVHEAFPAAALGYGLSGYAQRIAAMVDSGQRHQIAYTERVQDAAQQARAMVDTMTNAEQANTAGLGGNPS